MKNLGLRLRQMLLGWGGVGIIYDLSDHLQGPGAVLEPGLIDRLIPFSPVAVWPYLSFFLIVPLAYFACPPERLRWLRQSMQIAALCAGIVFVAWPTTMAYPDVPAGTLSATLLAGLIGIDSAQNCFPSLHMALTVLAILALHDRERPVRTLLLWLWGFVIGLSILQLRRHLFIDLVSGTALGFCVGWACGRFPVFTRFAQGASS